MDLKCRKKNLNFEQGEKIHLIRGWGKMAASEG